MTEILSLMQWQNKNAIKIGYKHGSKWIFGLNENIERSDHEKDCFMGTINKYRSGKENESVRSREPTEI